MVFKLLLPRRPLRLLLLLLLLQLRQLMRTCLRLCFARRCLRLDGALLLDLLCQLLLQRRMLRTCILLPCPFLGILCDGRMCLRLLLPQTDLLHLHILGRRSVFRRRGLQHTLKNNRWRLRRMHPGIGGSSGRSRGGDSCCLCLGHHRANLLGRFRGSACRSGSARLQLLWSGVQLGARRVHHLRFCGRRR